ncbi:MAG: hypothetical protein AAGE59_18705 [Cyanobacteria bacterium P01_F01_bin.86]
MNFARSRLLSIVVISFVLTVLLSLGIAWVMGGQPVVVRIALLTVILVPLITIALTYYLVSGANQSIRILIGIAQKVQANRVVPEDLRQLSKIATRRDGIGQLASVLRDMALALSEREQHHSEEIAHLQAQVRSGSQQATGLEMAYYEALRKKSAWLRQQFSEQSKIQNSEFKMPT